MSKWVKFRNIFLSLMGCLFVVLPVISSADVILHDSSVRQQSVQHVQVDLILQDRVEDLLIVSDSKYVYNKKTSVKSVDPEYPIQRVADLPLPSRVDLLYRTYSQETEEVPYPPGTKIVERITFVEKLKADIPAVQVKMHE